jgi:U32 family peptidase
MAMTPTADTAQSRPAAARRSRLPELLAPAGDWDCARAAVENGADAIYFGLQRFNARMRAHNFTEADLPKLMEFLHRRGVCGYVTLNTLVFENELVDAEKYLRVMIAAGVDAVIVQDIGICRLIRRLSPDFPIHASTQMTVTSAGGIEFARELGCNLVVLARECSLAEIGKINSILCAAHSELPIEVFVHGALCVAYSGQCLTSEVLGGRSANRGECAQACRMPYDLICDGKSVPLGDRKYLLSPQDLAGLEVLPDLVRAGVASLKIEGRLKTPEYVANITRIYRQALDDLRFANDDLRATNPSDRKSEIVSRKYSMEMAFSRGLYTGWFGGVNNQALVHGRFGKKRGVYLGEVVRVSRDAVVVKLEGPLKPGDGVVFDAGKPGENEEGGRVYQLRTPNSEPRNAELRFGRGDIDFARIHIGDKLWKTDDPELNRRLRRSFEGDAPKFQRPIEMEVHGVAGGPLTLIARDEFGHVVQFDSAKPLARAEKRPLTTERLSEQLGRLGGTPFKPDALKNHLKGEVLLPVSELNRLRREAVAGLEKLRAMPKRWTLNSSHGSGVSALGKGEPLSTPEPGTQTPDPALVVLVRNLPQFEAALKCSVETIYCEFEDPKKYRDAVALFHTARGCSDSQLSTLNLQPSIWVAPPRIFKTGEEWILQQIRSCNADGYLVRNYDHLKFFANDRRRGDYSLNVANRLAADYFKNQFGLERLTPSYDLNSQQLEALLRAAPPEWFEVTIHQHMPMFHMEHCVFCAFLSSGTDYTNCGRPCDRHDVKLRDRVGAEHGLKADAGCRNTVFNSLPQTGAEYMAKMIELGVRHFRVEFLSEAAETVEHTITSYRRLLRGEISGTQLWRELKLMNQLGVTRGQLGKP